MCEDPLYLRDRAPVASDDELEPCASTAPNRALLTRRLREQVRSAVQQFLQAVLDASENRTPYHSWPDPQAAATQLWHDGLILVYRLLFILKLESLARNHDTFRFTHSKSWNSRYSLKDTAADWAVTILDGGETSCSLTARLRAACRCFVDGVQTGDLQMKALGGGLFGERATSLLDSLHWDETASAALLSALIWQHPSRSKRIDYARLEIEDLGGIYEGLLELEPGITCEPMCRLRRAKLDLVVPRSQAPARVQLHGRPASKLVLVEEIPAHRFYVCVGFGRKASGSFYTPREFVRFLVRETLESQVAQRSPADDPNPCAILDLKVLDPTMGSGHFLVEVCRYLGQAVYDAQRQCEALATAAEAGDPSLRAAHWRTRADAFRGMCVDVQPQVALRHCRCLVARHCLYGVDLNPLAVELARAALWLLCASETLTLDDLSPHLVIGDALTGPRLEQLLTLPRAGARIDELNDSNPATALWQRVLESCRQPGSAQGVDALRRLAVAWTGCVMLGVEGDDQAYLDLFWSVLRGNDGCAVIAQSPVLQRAIELGSSGVSYELAFPGVFLTDRAPGNLGDVRGPSRTGFDAILGNPPWDAIKFNTKEFLAAYDLRVLDAPTKQERDRVEADLTHSPQIAARFALYQAGFERMKRTNDRNFVHQKLTVDGDLAGRQLDLYRVVLERACQLLGPTGYLGIVVPSSFHTAAGAVGVRRLVTERHRLIKYLSFVNTRKSFDISASIEFGLLVAAGLATPNCPTLTRFGLEDPELLASPKKLGLLSYPVTSLCRGNPYHSFPTTQDATALAALVSCRSSGKILRELLQVLGVDLRSTPTSVHMTHEAKYFVPRRFNENGNAEDLVTRYDPSRHDDNVLLHEGATFARFSDSWGDPPRFRLKASRVARSSRWQSLARHYKLALRAIVGSSREKCIATLLPPGCLVANSSLVEGAPEQRSNASALAVVGLLNSTVLNWLLSFYADLNVNLFALKYLPVSTLSLPSLLGHHALRLCSNHAGYAPLWRELMGHDWHESGEPFHWPALCPDARLSIRAEIDATVARWYNLDREQYQYILDTYEMPEGSSSTEACLAAFDQIGQLGIDEFSRLADPYWRHAAVDASDAGCRSGQWARA